MRRKLLLALCLLLLAANLAFIWGNSAMPAAASAGTSGRLHAWLTAHFGAFAMIGEKLLRKAAHFCEFASLGFLLRWLFLLLQRRGGSISGPMLFGLLAALADETIQLYNPGRGPSLLDVWLDGLGICAGIAALWVLTKLVKMIMERKRNK